jgi:hypothetical protein
VDLTTDTFVLIATDCPATTGTVPVPRGATPTVALAQYELLTARPYALTLEDLMVAVHVRRAGLADGAAAKAAAAAHREALRAKPYPCMRASPLPKTYGWGVHHDAAGRIAIYGIGSADYRRLAAGDGGRVAVVPAMRSKRAG